MLLLDTDVLIDIQRGHSSAVSWFAGLTDLPAFPDLVAMELIQGAANARQVRDADRLVRPLPIVWPTPLDCDQALANFQAFHLSHSLGLLDSLIGAIAVGLSAELCTFNQKHFRVIPSLVSVQPYTR